MAEREWTPMRGLMRGAIAAAITSTVLAGMLLGVIAIAPLIPFNGLLRAMIAVGVTWLILDVVHCFAGMVGWPCSIISAAGASAVMLSNHLAWAWLGCPMPGQPELVTGLSVWCSLEGFAIPSIFAAIGIGFGVALGHNGTPGPDLAGYVLGLSWWPDGRR